MRRKTGGRVLVGMVSYQGRGGSSYPTETGWCR